MGLAVDLGTSARAMQVCEFSWRVLFGFGWVGGGKGCRGRCMAKCKERVLLTGWKFFGKRGN